VRSSLALRKDDDVLAALPLALEPGAGSSPSSPAALAADAAAASSASRASITQGVSVRVRKARSDSQVCTISSGVGVSDERQYHLT
jgi:hypothetical protein